VRTGVHNTETAQKNIMVVSTILHHSNLPPFTELFETVNTFNASISRCASFLAENVICKVSEAFDEEMESSMEDVEEIIGACFSEMLAAQAHNAESSTSQPGAVFLRIVFQIFILKFCCIIEPCSVLVVIDASKHTSECHIRNFRLLTCLQISQMSLVGNIIIPRGLCGRKQPSKLLNPLW